MSKDLGTSPAFQGAPYKVWHGREWRQHIHILAHLYPLFIFVAHILCRDTYFLQACSSLCGILERLCHANCCAFQRRALDCYPRRLGSSPAFQTKSCMPEFHPFADTWQTIKYLLRLKA